jgi:hypothetical protein
MTLCLVPDMGRELILRGDSRGGWSHSQFNFIILAIHVTYISGQASEWMWLFVLDMAHLWLSPTTLLRPDQESYVGL